MQKQQGLKINCQQLQILSFLDQNNTSLFQNLLTQEHFVQINVIGLSKSGKSTKCNQLINTKQNIFSISQAPLTSLDTIFSSNLNFENNQINIVHTQIDSTIFEKFKAIKRGQNIEKISLQNSFQSQLLNIQESYRQFAKSQKQVKKSVLFVQGKNKICNSEFLSKHCLLVDKVSLKNCQEQLSQAQQMEQFYKNSFCIYVSNFIKGSLSLFERKFIKKYIQNCNIQNFMVCFSNYQVCNGDNEKSILNQILFSIPKEYLSIVNQIKQDYQNQLTDRQIKQQPFKLKKINKLKATIDQYLKHYSQKFPEQQKQFVIAKIKNLNNKSQEIKDLQKYLELLKFYPFELINISGIKFKEQKNAAQNLFQSLLNQSEVKLKEKIQAGIKIIINSKLDKIIKNIKQIQQQIKNLQKCQFKKNDANCQHFNRIHDTIIKRNSQNIQKIKDFQTKTNETLIKDIQKTIEQLNLIIIQYDKKYSGENDYFSQKMEQKYLKCLSKLEKKITQNKKYYENILLNNCLTQIFEQLKVQEGKSEDDYFIFQRNYKKYVQVLIDKIFEYYSETWKYITKQIPLINKQKFKQWEEEKSSSYKKFFFWQNKQNVQKNKIFFEKQWQKIHLKIKKLLKALEKTLFKIKYKAKDQTLKFYRIYQNNLRCSLIFLDQTKFTFQIGIGSKLSEKLDQIKNVLQEQKNKFQVKI